jgi:hypothetical protein
MSSQTSVQPTLIALPWLEVLSDGCLRSFFHRNILTYCIPIRRSRVMCMLWGWSYSRSFYLPLRNEVKHLISRLQVLAGAPPFAEMKGTQNIIIHVVMHGKRPARPVDSANMGISDTLWQLLQNCWSAELAKRPEVTVIRKFLQQATPTWDSRPPIQALSRNDEDSHTEANSSTCIDTTRSTSINQRPKPSAKVVSMIVIPTSF